MIFKRIVLIPFLCMVVLLSIALLPNNYSYNSGSGVKFEGFTLTDYEGNNHSLSDYTESKAIVIMLSQQNVLFQMIIIQEWKRFLTSTKTKRYLS